MINFLSFLYEYKPLVLFLASIGTLMTVFGFLNNPYSAIGLFFTRKFKKAKANHKYAILIPARNEAAVIGNLIESIKLQDYPKELLTVFVVADNCTDNTAEIARKNGAVCYEHNNPAERTKGFGLKYLFERIKEDYGIESFEGYFIFDSDNLLKSDYISRMNDSFDSGEKVICSYRNTKNFSENWISALYALHWLRSIRIRHRARSVLHLATNIQGTGFLFSSDLVKDGWKYTSLTEDRAFTADLVANGYEISYNNDAVFYDEQPTSLRVSVRQRFRWCKGHLEAFAESGPKLFLNIFIDPVSKKTSTFWKYLCDTLRHRLMAFDTLNQLIPKSVINIFKWILQELILHTAFLSLNGGTINCFGKSTALGKAVNFFFGSCPVTIKPGLKGYFISFLLLIWIRIFYRLGIYLKDTLMAVYIFIIEHKRIPYIPLYKKIGYCFLWPLFDLADRYLKIAALFKRKVEWKVIPHESKITINDISSENNRHK
ncbi:MAG: glycosyltransferase family 2 protein [Clostridia bacterium]|nr:glycosyltransferase family 2 protein [Clostridia bacterium]